MKHLHIMNALFEIAKGVNPIKGSRIAAAIVDNGDILSIGTNQRKTHPFQARYARNSESIFLHAENAAINKVKKFPRKAILYICRAKWLNEEQMGWGVSKPCEGCMKAIKDHNISTVIYSKETIFNVNDFEIVKYRW